MIEIRPLQLHQVPAAKRVMCEVCNEIWQFKPTVEELIQELDEAGEFYDLNNLESYYFQDNGTFLAIVDNQEVVGTGSIRRMSDDICELRRMWILRAYRAQGWGKVIAEALLQFAKERDYTRVRLEVYYPPKQQRAIAFYKALGFYEIAPYKDSPAKLFMEKRL